MNEIRNGYTLRTPLSTAQSGTAQWCFATGKGGEWFLKEFLSPIYPDAELKMTSEVRARKQQRFENFRRDKERLHAQLQKADDGNLVIAKEVFRCENHLNIVTERIHPGDLAVEQVFRMPPKPRDVLLRTLVHNVHNIHQQGVVHADLKPTNIIFKATSEGFYTVKLIDFDNSFLEAAPPSDPESFAMDLVYMTPEVFRFITGDASIQLNHKLDVFSLGILLHIMLSGELPAFDEKRYHYIYEVILDGGACRLSCRIEPRLAAVLGRMLAVDPRMRPELDEVYSAVIGNPAPPPLDMRSTPGKMENPYLKPAKSHL